MSDMTGAEYEAIHRAAIDAYEAATPPDCKYSAVAFRKAVDAALSLRQQAQPTREEGAVRRLIKNIPSIIEDHTCGGSDTRPIVDVDGLVGAITEHLSALLPIDAPAHEGGGEVREAVQSLITELGRWDRWVVGANQAEKTGANKVKAEVAARLIAILASHAEPAAHSLQTLAPASDAVKPGDET